MARCALLFIVLATALISGQTTGDGEIIGRITDVAGGAVPGARVSITSITSGDERWEMFTDREGRFALRSLRLGTYNVTVDLEAFVTQSGAITLSATVPRAQIGWRLEVGCIAAVSHVILSPRAAAPVAAAIVHVQVVSDDGPMLRSTRPECPGGVEQAYTVQVLDVVARRGGSVEIGSTQQLFRWIHQDPLQPGAQYVALTGTSLLLPVVSGRISSSAGESLNGMTVEEALEVLGQWSRERSQ